MVSGSDKGKSLDQGPTTVVISWFPSVFYPICWFGNQIFICLGDEANGANDVFHLGELGMDEFIETWHQRRWVRFKG